MDDNIIHIILGIWLRISHNIGSDMCYWVLTVSGKVIAWNMVQHVIHTELINPDMKQQIAIFYEELEKQFYDTNFVDDVGAHLYIDDMDEADKSAHGDGPNTPSDEAYGEMITEERPKQEDIDNAALD